MFSGATPSEVIKEVTGMSAISPEFPEEIQLFASYNEASSLMLKNDLKSQ